MADVGRSVSSSPDLQLSDGNSSPLTTTSLWLQLRLTVQTSCSTVCCSVTHISSWTIWRCSVPSLRFVSLARQRTTLVELHEEDEQEE